MRTSLILAIFFFLSSVFAKEKITVFVDENRFLNKQQNTIMDINYQIGYQEMAFVKTDDGFISKLNVALKIKHDKKVVFEEDYDKEILLKEKSLTVSDRSFYDRISLTLKKKNYFLELKFLDVFSGKTAVWEHHFEKLPENSLLSDLEFSVGLHKASEKEKTFFRRGDIVYDINPDHIFTKFQDNLVIYYEIQNFAEDSTSIQNKIEIVNKDSTIFFEEKEIVINTSKSGRFETIDLTDFPEGYSQIKLSVKDLQTGDIEVRENYFSIMKKREKRILIFEDLEKEIELIKYFLQTSQKKALQNLSEDGKRNFAQRFWTSNDLGDSKNSFQELVLDRIEYANEQFSSFKKGWKTDRGRIYIKHGAPVDIIKGESGSYTKFTKKDYQIWKYRSHYNATYIFLDVRADKNYKLIYSENDDTEISHPNWREYMGKDFDEGLLY